MPVLVRLPFENRLTEPKEERRVRNGIDPVEGHMTKEWALAFTNMQDGVNQSPTRLQTVELTGQSASIGATALAVGVLSEGLYRVTYYARITRAATTSSSLQVTFDWTDGTVAQSHSFTAITGNLTTTHDSQTIMIHIDANTPVRYSTTYASVGGTSMLYRLDVTIERIAA